MRRPLTLLVPLTLFVWGVLQDRAAAQDQPTDYRRSMGNLRPDARTAGRAIQGSNRPIPHAPQADSGPGHPGHGSHGGHGHRGHGPGYDYGYGYGYDPYAPYGYPYDYPYFPPAYPIYPYPPPLYLPGETIYGPETVKRFMGVPPYGPAPSSGGVIVVPEKKVAASADLLRSTNAEAVALGRKFIGYGDAQFIQQQFAQAYLRYKKAAQSAPRLAQAYFRQGWSLVASGRYELAVAAFEKGLELDPDWPASAFRLDELYGPNRAAKTAHVDALAAAAGDEPQNADLLFLIGVFLFFDGQPHRARPFFEQTASLPGGANAPVGGFLAKVQEGEL